MSDIAQDLAKQQELGGSIQRVEINYRKDSATRKSKEYFETKLRKLEERWTDFHLRDVQLQAYRNKDPNNKYFVNKFAEQVHAAYISAKDVISEGYHEMLRQEIDNSDKEPIEEHDQQAQPGCSQTNQDQDDSQQPGVKTVTFNLKGREEGIFNRELENMLKVQISKMAALLRIVEVIENEADNTKSTVYYQQKIQTLQNYWNQIERNHDELIKLAGPHETNHEYFEEQKYEQTEDIYQTIIIQLQELSARTRQDNQNMENQTANRDKPNGAKIKLPPITIPRFNGDYNTWRQFHDLFAQLVHTNENLSTVQKMQYLKANLSDEAAQLVGHLSITNDNYITAWGLLINRYENKRLLVRAQLNTLLSQADANDSANSIKNLHDTTNECLFALKNLGIEVESWDAILIHILSKKLDKDTQKLYELSLKSPRDLPKLSEFLAFLELRFQALENIKSNRDPSTQSNNRQVGIKAKLYSKSNIKNYHIKGYSRCEACGGNHKLYECSKFIKSSHTQKQELLNNYNLCKLCLRPHHMSECNSKKTCKICNSAKHNTLLHLESQNKQLNFQLKKGEDYNKTKSTYRPNRGEVNKQKSSINYPKPGTSSSHCQENSDLNHTLNVQTYNSRSTEVGVMLVTAIVKVRSLEGREETLRALVDQGSQVSFIKEDAVQRLRLKRSKVCAEITVVNDIKIGSAKSKVSFQISSIYPSSFKLWVSAFVLKSVSKPMPDTEIISTEIDTLKNLPLADPHAFSPGPIDIILGAEVYDEIMLEGVKKGSRGYPLAQKTELGWILSGKVPVPKTVIKCHVSQIKIDESLKRFWDLEELAPKSETSKEEILAEQIYTATVARDHEGRYTVHLPFNEKINDLGYSKGRAMCRLLQMERKFQRDDKFKDQYQAFIKEYQNLGHMRPTLSTQNACYLPHHAVLKADSTTTKLRVVFDASCPTSSGLRLNDALLKGPQLQQDLMSILIRWRKHKFVISSDIEKMYRQIKIVDAHQDYQRILWRETPQAPLQQFNLTTVTYGTKPAPFLAIRTLYQLANDEGQNFVRAATVLKQDFYVDDLLTGADTIASVKELRIQLDELLSRGGFKLRKWASNSMSILEGIHESDKEQNLLSLSGDTKVKTLGIYWCPHRDTFTFKVNTGQQTITPTKRVVLSEWSQLFDPLGWLAPCIIKAKLMFQSLWKANLSWDEELPNPIHGEWRTLRNQFSDLEKIEIPRWVHVSRTNSIFELHGFCDASARAYAAVVYTRTIDHQGSVHVQLLTAKTKVAPLSKEVSLPRLELCAAVLLAKLLSHTVKAVNIEGLNVHAWSDSKVTLAWIQNNNRKYSTFVTNRTREINNLIPMTQWHYVKSKQNPADCASRGLDPSKLINFTLWWDGPEWLRQKEIEYITNSEPTDHELKSYIQVTFTLKTNDTLEQLLSKTNDFQKLLRIIAYCLRFRKLMKRKVLLRTNYINIQELREARNLIIKLVQEQEFSREITDIKLTGKVSQKSKILSLNPFLDKNGILRVGGRLRNSSLGDEAKFPIIISPQSPLSALIISEAHLHTLHGGPTLTLSHIRQRYWILNGTNSVKKQLHKCITCRKLVAKPLTQLMGDLPRPRVAVTKPFTHCGVDYAGPITLKLMKGRGKTTFKGYIAVFICLATKAIHIEVVSDLTAEAFVAGYKRFAARRGRAAHIYSDNGTNFVLANKILKFHSKEEKTEFFEVIQKELLKQETEWHFIPPAAPHFGGLWEAGVRSIKYHLKRVIGNSILNFEEMYTLLTQIEACLNSRPLCPLSADSEDLDVLTPGHFLVGMPLLSVPMQSLSETPMNRLKRWQVIEKMHQTFWNKWRHEYLSRLQQRPKWMTNQENIKIGDIVLLTDEQTPPTHWPLARVVETHPGPDSQVRVATVATGKGKFKRPITKLARLPVSQDEDDSAASTELHTEGSQMINRNDQQKTATKRSRGRYSAPHLLQSLLVLLLVISPSYALNKSLVTHPLTARAGLYFEDLGYVNLVNNAWKIIVYYDLESYWKEYEGIKGSIQQIEGLCSSDLTKVNFCPVLLEQLQHSLTEIEHKNELITGRGLNNKLRNRRSPLNIVGNVAHGLFGILDDEFARKYEEQINLVKDNENYLLQLIRNQTSIADSTSNIIKKNNKAISDQFLAFKHQLAEIQRTINNTNQELAKRDRYEAFTTAMFHATLMLLAYQNTQEALFQLITDTQHEKVSPLLLTPEQLRSQLALIRGNIPETVTIPGSTDQKGILQTYNLMKIRSKVMERYILFDISIPLPNIELLQLFKLIPTPILDNGKYIYVHSVAEYLVTSLHRDYYVPLSKSQVESCVPTENNRRLCQQSFPLYNHKSIVGRCEMSILTRQQTLSEYCKIDTMDPVNLWISMQSPNRWIYCLRDDYNFDVICGSVVHPYTLNGSGILELQPGCTLKQDSMVITSYHIFGGNIRSSYTPTASINIPVSNSGPSLKTSSPNIPLIFSDMSELEQAIKYQKQREAQGTCLIMGLIYLYRKRQQRIHRVGTPEFQLPTISRTMHPQPTPRR